MTEITCPELERELDALADDPMTRAYGIGSEMSPLVRELHEKRHGCARTEERWESAGSWDSGARSAPIPGSPLPRSAYARVVPLQDQLVSEGKCAETSPRGAAFCTRESFHAGSHQNVSAAWDVFAIPQGRLQRTDQGTRFAEEASTLGLPPGSFPLTIRIELDARGMEPAMPEDFRRVSIGRDADGDVTSVVYATRLRQTFLEIWDD